VVTLREQTVRIRRIGSIRGDAGCAGTEIGEEWLMTDTGGIVVERDVMVPARDGVLLATDIYRPDDAGRFPVLLERTPYDKSAPSRSERTATAATPWSRAEVAAYFLGHGYAVVNAG
jgi:predicted acyl esterase